VIPPNIEGLSTVFFDVEKNAINYNGFDTDRQNLKSTLSFEVFINQLSGLICSKEVVSD
jgi:hypothetical protein